MIQRIIDWLIGRTEPKTVRLDEIERRLNALSLRLDVRTRGKR